MDSFQDAFDRYIPYTPSVTSCQSNKFNNLDENQNVTLDDVTDEKCDNKLNLFNSHEVTNGIESYRENKDIITDITERWETGTI